MNKHTIIVIIASILIAGTIGFTFWNIILIEQIHFGTANQSDFRFFGLINEEEITLCNPSPFYTTFNNLKIKMVYEGQNIGELDFPGVFLEPNSNITKKGQFETETFEEVQYYSMHFDAMFLGTIAQRIDPAKMAIQTEIQTQILGFIPYTLTNQYTALEFWEMMNDDQNIC